MNAQRTGLNSGVVICFIGEMGGGKTLSAVAQCITYYRLGYRIYSNIKLKIPFTPFSLEEFLKMKNDNQEMRNAVILIDEAHIWADSRNSQKKRNKVISYLLNQTRKRSIRVLLTTQDFGLIEKRIRTRTNLLIYCSKVTEGGIEKVQNEILKPHSADTRTQIIRFNPKPFYPYYDTDEIVSIPDEDE